MRDILGYEGRRCVVVGAATGMGEACAALDCPVVSGNVSLYNETNGKAILPTPVIGCVGVMPDIAKAVTPAFKATGETIFVIGETIVKRKFLNVCTLS